LEEGGKEGGKEEGEGFVMLLHKDDMEINETFG
jgi:hypothetical protein